MRFLSGVMTLAVVGSIGTSAQVWLADESDRAAFRSWFVLLADAQFEERAPEVTDCAALVRFAFREALRVHTTEWVKRVRLPFTPTFPDVRSAPAATASGWPLFRVAGGAAPRYAEFADARTLVAMNARLIGRDTSGLQPGDLLYFNQPTQSQSDHLMVFVGRSFFDRDAPDWVVYHTGPLDGGPGEIRKVRLRDLMQHPAPRWRPRASNSRFVGVFRLLAL
jgi:uncharacterized protein YfaT (DUF1175 family)